jgi:hypothetical protein
MAIIGMHALMYSKKDRETREFLRDVLGFSSVDAGRGWLIFTAPPAELAVHPTEGEEYQELYLMCDDLESTAADLRTKGVEIGEIHEQPWGRVTTIPLPSGASFGLYQPKHPLAIRSPQ